MLGRTLPRSHLTLEILAKGQLYALLFKFIKILSC